MSESKALAIIPRSLPEVRFGDPRLPVNFWEKVCTEPNSGCWLWLGYVCPEGYGRFNASRMMGETLAHRVALTATGRASDLDVDHRCDTPSCVNPAHLDLVTNEINQHRRRDRSRSCRRGHAWTPENTGSRVRGHLRLRVCLECQKFHRNKRAAKKAA